MSAKRGRGRSYRIIRCERVTKDIYAWLQVAAQRYREESGDQSPTNYGLDRVREFWVKTDKRIMLWMLIERSVVQGYGITEICEDFKGKYVYVTESWIAPPMRRKRVHLFAFKKWADWGREHEANRIRFSSFRSATAYLGYLGEGWSQAEVTFEREI